MPARSAFEALMERFVEEVIFPRMEEVFDQMTGRMTGETTRKVTSDKARSAPKPKPKHKAQAPVPKPQFTLYDRLQVSPVASAEVITAAYKSLAKVFHPDVNKSKRAEEIMKTLNYAYATLTDPQKRKAYDRSIGL